MSYKLWVTAFTIYIVCLAPGMTIAQASSRTESNCNIGMVKGDNGKSCEVPIPDSCTVATYPGYDDPWAEVDKAGRIQCKFDEKQTDWKTRILGTCGKCETSQCTARFIVNFTCTHNIPPANPKNLPGK